MSKSTQLAFGLALAITAALGACGDDESSTGKPGADGTSCTVTDNGDGSATITCDDGTTTTIGGAGNGTSCSVEDNGDGSATITCDDGTEVTVNGGMDGDPGSPGITGNPGKPGLGEGETPGLVVDVTANTPANGTHFVSGDVITVTFTLEDADGNPILLSDLSRAGLYMNGPRDVLKTVAAVDLLGAGTDRSQSVHHYVDLLADPAPAQLTVNENMLTYTMNAVTTEEDGTYTVGLWAIVGDYPLDQTFTLQDVQIGTATEEPLIVGNCADCHKGAANGVMYMHHVDPGFSPYGNPALDSDPVRTCKMCHNQEGYAAVRKCDDGSKPVSQGGGVYLCADNTQNWSYMNDPIVRRVHGVHNGSNLLSAFNTAEPGGDFEDYLHVTFPFGVRNCDKCHTGNEFKMKPSRQTCGACHDQLDFATGTHIPPKVKDIGAACTVDSQCDTVFSGFDGVCNTTTGDCELQTHAAGPLGNDPSTDNCTVCHTPDTGLAAITVAHDIIPSAFPYTVEISMTNPANGTHYVAGEAPVVTVVIKDLGGTPIDHNTMGSTWNRSYLFVNGPRERRIPQLTTAARAELTTTVAGPTWDLSAAVDLQLALGDTQLTLDVADGTFANLAAATASEVAAWINADAGFAALGFATATANAVTLHALPSSRQNALEIFASDVATAMGFTVGTYTAKSASTSYSANPIYQHTVAADDDPKVNWNTGNVQYQLDDVAYAQPGTYSVWVRVGNSSIPNPWALYNFQVGTATEEPKIATNCVDCHGDKYGEDGFHGKYEFNADLCGSCHDYRRAADDAMPGDPTDGWGINAVSGRSNAGFGAAPLMRRIHGVHFGKYLENPYEIHASYGEEFGEIIFPQDVRNCVKCHSESNSFSEKPSRLACLACHDSASAAAHATIMTVDPTPWDAWNGDEQESCAACHGDGSAFSSAETMNISDPYVPPYPR